MGPDPVASGEVRQYQTKEQTRRTAVGDKLRQIESEFHPLRQHVRNINQFESAKLAVLTRSCDDDPLRRAADAGQMNILKGGVVGR